MTISAAPTAVTLNRTAGSNPSTTTVAISTTGSPAWTATNTKPWLTLSQASGTGAVTLSVGASAANMTAGTYSDMVTISSTSASNSPATVNVTLNVTAATQPPPTGNGKNWYVSPSGSPSGTGSISSPWDIVTALAQPAAVRPGDTIWVRAGKYGGGQYN